ncbi:MAG: family 20 glycosylhydrolase, partial [Muribaculaceae bacterium]|nr:family 20 glycosylhydrolase [Muribaculaceae bacterium]
MKRISFFLVSSVLAALTSGAAVKASLNTIPLPDVIEATVGAAPFTLGANPTVEAPAELAKDAELLRSYLPTGLKGKSSGIIELRADLKNDNPEAYQITVTPDRIVINGSTTAGTFYGIQTLRKAIPATLDRSGRVEIPSGEVAAAPRFAYRGTHFDVSRHFFTVDEVKTFIDMIALHGINTLHWHLTDAQGWRIESKKSPRLTEIGSYRPNS